MDIPKIKNANNRKKNHFDVALAVIFNEYKKQTTQTTIEIDEDAITCKWSSSNKFIENRYSNRK